ncbi:hypothetical protein [Bradyrhizobium sp. LMG 9283]|uniref:hypothetical protein n=1 Tax=Bradyrhizobium sp. LMG 9283 TaxID=592064 RepID=UPI00388E8A10
MLQIAYLVGQGLLRHHERHKIVLASADELENVPLRSFGQARLGKLGFEFCLEISQFIPVFVVAPQDEVPFVPTHHQQQDREARLVRFTQSLLDGVHGLPQLALKAVIFIEAKYVDQRPRSESASHRG